MSQSQGAQEFAARLRGARGTRARHEDAALQLRAAAAVPSRGIAARLGVAGPPEGDDGDDEDAGDGAWARGWARRLGAEDRDRLLLELMRWFKREFFAWAGKLPCPGCESKDTHSVRGADPLEHERADLAGRVEIYECKSCGAEFRFPRYNNPGKLLETRVGRCGEWANCFGLLLRALGFEARYVLDWTDHVWCEVWSDRVSRWVHCDCCEGPTTIDSPYMYEAGWGKKLNYIVAFGIDHVVDVTQRYTQDFEQLKPRRTAAPEVVVDTLILEAHSAVSRDITPSTRARLLMEQFDFHDASRADLKDAERHGRVSGDVEWKRLRGEDGHSSTT